MNRQLFDAVIVAGSRHWIDWETIAEAIQRHVWQGGMILNGDCKGADRIAKALGDRQGFRVLSFPYLREHGKAGGPIRNAQMLNRLLEIKTNLGKDIGVLAFHDDPNVETAPRGGTADMIRRTRKAGVPYLLFRSAPTPEPAPSGEEDDDSTLSFVCPCPERRADRTALGSEEAT